MNIKLELDAGCDITIINTDTWWKLGKFWVRDTATFLRIISGKKLHFMSKRISDVAFCLKILKADFFGVEMHNEFTLNRLDGII